MPNHVKTIINFHGEDKDIEKVLSLIKGDDMNVDFNKLIPKPESLNIESSSNTERGISLYLTFINPYVQYYGNKEDMTSVRKTPDINRETDIFLKRRCSGKNRIIVLDDL